MAVQFDKLLGRPVLHGHRFTSFEMVDANGVVWTVTIDTSGNLSTTSIQGGNPMGLLLALTYPSAP